MEVSIITRSIVRDSTSISMGRDSWSLCTKDIILMEIGMAMASILIIGLINILLLTFN
jgi:hypothetical protein